MLKNIILFLVLISFSNCANIIQEIKIDSESMTSLNTTLDFTTYFFMTLENTDIAGMIYFYMTDNNYSLSYNNIKVCYTTDEPNQDSTLSDCEWKELTPYEKTDSNPKEYFYKNSYIPSFYKRYLIVRYTGLNPDGELKVQSSLTDLYQKIKEKVKDIIDSALSVLAIIGIVIGSIIGGCLLLACICAIFGAILERGEKAKISTEISENPDSKPAIEIPDKPTELLNPQTNEEPTEPQNIEKSEEPNEPITIQTSEEPQS